MNTKMNGKKIKSIFWHDVEITSKKGRKLSLSASYHGDHDEFWIIEELNGKEVARHNPRYVETIIWDEG